MGTPASRSIARWVRPRPPSTARIWIAVSHSRSRRLTVRDTSKITTPVVNRGERAGPGGRRDHSAFHDEEQAAHAAHVGHGAVGGEGGGAGPAAGGAGGDHDPSLMSWSSAFQPLRRGGRRA